MDMITKLLALLIAAGFAEAASPVPVTVYYESLCPDSIKFYINQLYPTMEIADFSVNVAVDLIPYGKSTHEKSSNGSWAFTCHHGERECYGNKVHACVLEKMSSKNERLKYLNCLLKTMLPDRKAEFPVKKCADETHITSEDVDRVIACANGTEGDELLARMGDRTQMLQPKLSSVPTVVFNNKYEQNDFEQAQTNFKGVLCKYISEPKPEQCSGASGAPTLGLSLLLFPVALFFVLLQHIQSY